MHLDAARPGTAGLDVREVGDAVAGRAAGWRRVSYLGNDIDTSATSQ